MTEFLFKTIKWKVAVGICCLYVFVSMANITISAIDNWTIEYVAGFNWWDWLKFTLSILVAGATSIISFLDKTAQREGDKIKKENGQS